MLIEHLQKTSTGKTGNIAGVLEQGNLKKPTSNEQMKKLFDNGELERTESKNPAQLTEDDLVLPRSLFRPTRPGQSTLANINNSGLAKNPGRS